MMYVAASDSRNATACAMSSGSPEWPIGTRAAYVSSVAKPVATNSLAISVRIVPGATALTRIRSGPHSTASERTRPLTPAFAAQYAARPPIPSVPLTEEIITMLPPAPAADRCGYAARAPRNGAVRLTDSSSSQSLRG